MTSVVRLNGCAVPAVSSEAIEEILDHIPRAAWADFLGDVTFALTRDMAALERAFEQNDLDEGIAITQRVSEAAAGVGLHELASVAQSLCEVLDVDDQVAAAALAARLLRFGAASLVALVATRPKEPSPPTD